MNQSSKEKRISSKAMTLILGVLTACSRVLGFARQIIFTSIFGAGAIADVFNFVFVIPNNLRKLLAEGALSSAYIPVLSESIANKEPMSAVSRIVRTVLTFQLMILLPLILLLILFSPSVVRRLSDFKDPDQVLYAISIFRYLIVYLLLVSISAILMATLNSISKFVVSGLTPILFSVSVIGSVLFFHKALGLYSMVLGVLLGGFAQIIFQIPLFIKKGFSLMPLFDFKSLAFKKIMLRYFPVVISSSIFMGLQMFASYLGSKMEEGSISSLSNSMVIWQLPFGIFSVSIMTVLFPKMSRQSARKDKEGLRVSIEEGISGFIAFIIPSSIFLFLGAMITVSAIYLRGHFDVGFVPLTAKVLQAYSVGILFVSIFQFLLRYFYAQHQYRIPFIAAIVVALLDIILSIFFYKKGLGAAGLAWANTIAYAIASFLLWVIAAWNLGGIKIKGLGITFLKVGVCQVPMIMLLMGYNHFFSNLWQHPSNSLRVGVLGILALVSIVITLVLYFLFRVTAFSDLVTNRFRPKELDSSI